MFHAAIATSQYMLIVGGGTPTYNFTNTVLAYRFDCNKWLNLTNEGEVQDCDVLILWGLSCINSDFAFFVFERT